MTAPKLSVIVPIHNGEEFLAECLASVERQTLRELEVLCVDDASTDGSAAIVAQFAAQDERFRLIQLPANVGAAQARNAGLDEAAGEFACFIDCDDFYPNDATLAHLLQAAEGHGVDVAGGCMGNYRMDTGQLFTDYSFDAHLQACYCFEREGVVDYRSWQGDYGYTRFVYRTELLREHDVRFPDIRLNEDPVFFVHAMLAAGKFYALPEVVYCHRIGHKEASLDPEAAEEALDAILGLIDLSIEQDLPLLRSYQYHLIRWYAFDAPIQRGFGSWREIADVVGKQAVESFSIRATQLIDQLSAALSDSTGPEAR